MPGGDLGEGVGEVGFRVHAVPFVLLGWFIGWSHLRRLWPRRGVVPSSLSDWGLADRGMERRFALREPATGCCTGWRRGQRFWHERGIPLWLKGKRHMRSYRVVRAKIRFMFQAMVTRLHSPRTLLSPRSRNCRKPRTDLMMPNTGSGVCLRRP